MNNGIKDLKQDENGHFEDVMKHGIPALILIVIGGGLLASNLLDISFDNWWAFFLLIPMTGMVYHVWRDYDSNGRLTNRSAIPLVGSLVLVTTLTTFLFDVDWGQLWPLAFVFGGIAALLGRQTSTKN